jgi:hypothetical protein
MPESPQGPGPGWYEGAMAPGRPARHLPGMTKRIAAGILWFLAVTTGGEFAAFMWGTPQVVAPLIGLMAALFIAGDPLGLIWKKSDVRAVRNHAQKRLEEVLTSS